MTKEIAKLIMLIMEILSILFLMVCAYAIGKILGQIIPTLIIQVLLIIGFLMVLPLITFDAVKDFVKHVLIGYIVIGIVFLLYLVIIGGLT